MERMRQLQAPQIPVHQPPMTIPQPPQNPVIDLSQKQELSDHDTSHSRGVPEVIEDESVKESIVAPLFKNYNKSFFQRLHQKLSMLVLF